MAQSRSTSGRKRSSTGRKSSSTGRKTSSSSSSRARSSAPSSESSTFADYFHAFTKTRAFPPIACAVVLTVLILLDLLISWNNYDRFFKILGFELLFAGIIWGLTSFYESTPYSKD